MLGSRVGKVRCPEWGRRNGEEANINQGVSAESHCARNRFSNLIPKKRKPKTTESRHYYLHLIVKSKGKRKACFSRICPRPRSRKSRRWVLNSGQRPKPLWSLPWVVCSRSEFRSRSQGWVLRKEDIFAHKGWFQLQVGNEHAKVKSDLFHFNIKRQNF